MCKENVLLIAGFYLIIVLSACNEKPQVAENLMESIEIVDSLQRSEPATLLYGIAVDSFEMIEGRIRWNQTLGKILAPYNVPNESLLKLSALSKNSYDVRKLKAGTNFLLLCSGEGVDKKADYFIFEPDQTSYVVYSLGDSIYVHQEFKPVTVQEKSITATINSSVYVAALDAGASPLLVSKLVDILAWQVDFFRIQKGDSFKVLYEEEVAGDQVVGIRQIKAIYFEHYGKPYYGINYVVDGKSDYFDEDGNSLRKAFLRAPLNYKRISSRYSPKRFHPVLKQYKSHLGTDYAADPGTPIMTVGDGVVIEAGYGKYNGNYVKIRHNSNYSTQYLHMQKIKTGIKPGVAVKQGQVIGFVGSTGLANGPHLCFRFWKNGVQVDALSVDLPPTEPISTQYLNAYLHYKNMMIHRLDNIDFDGNEQETDKSLALR